MTHSHSPSKFRQYLLMLFVIVITACGKNIELEEKPAPSHHVERSAESASPGADDMASGRDAMSGEADDASFPSEGVKESPDGKKDDASEESEKGEGKEKKPEGKPSQKGLTAGSFRDGLNLDAFLNYLQRPSTPKISLPEASPFQFTMDKAALETLIPQGSSGAVEELEIALVLDATGSMGDELSYLQSEWKTILSDLEALHPTIKLRTSLVVYRDVGESFVTAKHDFTLDKNAFKAQLDKFSAGGGGDFPEAVDKAFIEANTLSWSAVSNAKAKRLLFWIADAPAHDDKEALAMAEVLKLKAKGVKIFPLAASGVEDRAEVFMRISALLTGGQYLFLTDDSGIGGSHAEPKIPCYNVELLSSLMVRVMSEEISGVVTDTKPENILRSVGVTEKGVCKAPPAANP